MGRKWTFLHFHSHFPEMLELRCGLVLKPKVKVQSNKHMSLIFVTVRIQAYPNMIPHLYNGLSLNINPTRRGEDFKAPSRKKIATSAPYCDPFEKKHLTFSKNLWDTLPYPFWQLNCTFLAFTTHLRMLLFIFTFRYTSQQIYTQLIFNVYLVKCIYQLNFI